MACRRRISVRRAIFFTTMYAGVILATGSFVVAKMITAQAITRSTTEMAAEWNVAITGMSLQSQDENIGLVAGDDSQLYRLTVINDSDVASRYTLKVSGIPNGVGVGLDQGALSYPSSGVVFFNNTGQELTPHNNREHILEFAAKMATEEINNQDISIEVVFTQKEPQ